jgi:hypothetical protein
VVKSDVETTPSSDDGSETGLIIGVIITGFLTLLTLGLGIGHIVSWELLFNFIWGSLLMLPLTEMTFSVRLYLFIPYTTTAYTYLLRSAFTTLLVFGRFFTATLMEVRPFTKINPLRKLFVEPS